MTILTKNQLDKSLREVLASMEEDKEYILTQEAWDEYQEARKSFGWSKLDDRYHKLYSFRVRNNQLLFDCRDNHILIEDISKATATVWATTATTATATSMTTWSVTAMVTALITNQIELKEKPSKSCDGKIVEIDGKKYEFLLVLYYKHHRLF